MTSMTSVIRKRKLTTEQKNNIVKLAKTNPKMKQDEIARQFGVDRSTISKVLTESKKPKRAPSETGDGGEMADEGRAEDEPVEQLTQDNYSRGTRSRSSSSSQSYNQAFGSSPLDIASTPFQSHYSPYSSYSSSLDSFQSINDHFDSLSFTNYISYDDSNVTQVKALDALGVVKKYLEQQLTGNDGVGGLVQNQTQTQTPTHSHSHSYSHSFIPNSEDINHIDSLMYRIQTSMDDQLGFY